MIVNPDVLAEAMKKNIRIEEAKEKAWAREKQESQELLSCIEAGMCPICGGGIQKHFKICGILSIQNEVMGGK